MTVHIGSGPDTDNRDLQSICDHLAHLVRDTLKQHNIGAGILQSLRGRQHFLRLVRLSALHLESADLVNRLGFQSQVRANRNIVSGKMRNDLNLIVPAFQLDHHRTALLHKPDCVVERHTGLGVTHEGHIGDQKGAPKTASNGPRVINDVVNGDRHSCVVTLDYHSQRITHQNEIGSGRINQYRIARVVGSETGNRLTFLLHLLQSGDVDGRLRHAALFKLCVHGFGGYQAIAAAAGLKKCRPPVHRSICWKSCS